MSTTKLANCLEKTEAIRKCRDIKGLTRHIKEVGIYCTLKLLEQDSDDILDKLVPFFVEKAASKYLISIKPRVLAKLIENKKFKFLEGCLWEIEKIDCRGFWYDCELIGVDSEDKVKYVDLHTDNDYTLKQIKWPEKGSIVELAIDYEVICF